MAAITESIQVLGKFYHKCGKDIKLSKDRRIASGKGSTSSLVPAFSNDPIPNGMKFSIMILRKGSELVRPPLGQISMRSKSAMHALDRFDREPRAV